MPRLEDLELQIKQTGAGVSRIDKLTASLDKLASAAGKTSASAKAIKSLGDSIKEASSAGIAEGMKHTAEQMGKVSDGAAEASKTVNTFKRTVKTTTTHTHSFAKSLLLTPINAFKNKVEGLIKPIGNLWRSFKRIAMYRALRTALKEITQGFATGVKNLYAWSGLVGNSFKGTMDSLATSLNYLRNSLGAMVSPLLDALAPAVDVLVDKFVDLVNLVNQFFATITGKTSWRKALKTQKEYADNTNDAAAAQAKLNHQLMAFDELNNISPNSPSGGRGGGSDDGVSADDFEEVILPDWAQDIRDAIERGDWAGAGQALADKLNGLINDWDANAAGKAMGQKLQSALTAYTSFMRTMDWKGLGQKIAGYLNGFLDEVDPDTLGEALVAKFNAAIGFLDGFANDFDWAAAGTWIVDVIVGAITGLDWATLGDLVGSIAGGLYDAITAGIDELVNNAGDIMTAIGKFFTGLGWDGLINVVKLATIVKGFKLLFTAVFGDDGLISTVKTKMGDMLSSAASGLGGTAGTVSIGIGVGLAVHAVGSAFKNIKKYGVAKGLIKTFGSEGEWADQLFAALNGTGTTFLVAECLWKMKMDIDSGLFQKNLAKTIASKPVQNAIKFINAMLRLAGLEEIKIEFQFPGLEQGRKDSYNLDNNLGGLKKTYTTTVNAKNLTGNTTNANKFKTALVDVNGQTYRTTVSTSGLTGNTKSSTTYKDNLTWASGKKVTSTFSASGLDSAAANASTVKSDLSGVNNKTFWTTLSSSTLTDAANSAKKLYDNLNNAAKTWTVKVNGQIELTDPGKKYKLEASGGYVSAGTAFIAGEAGPELVGTINGRTGVVSANEISGIGDAIYNTGETEAALLAEQNALLRQILAKTGITLTPNAAAGKWVAQAQTAYARATGG